MPETGSAFDDAMGYLDHVDAYEGSMKAILALAVHCSPQQWLAETECPGWAVRDVVAHVVDVESWLLGQTPHTMAVTEFGSHVRTNVGRRVEPGVQLRRSRSQDDVIAELQQVLTDRLTWLGAAGRNVAELVDNPLGDAKVSLGNALQLRIFDIWTHEQDLRRALNRPGGDDSPAAEVALRFAAGRLGRVLTKVLPTIDPAVAEQVLVVEFVLTDPLPGRVRLDLTARTTTVHLGEDPVGEGAVGVAPVGVAPVGVAPVGVAPVAAAPVGVAPVVPDGPPPTASLSAPPDLTAPNLGHPLNLPPPPGSHVDSDEPAGAISSTASPEAPGVVTITLSSAAFMRRIAGRWSVAGTPVTSSATPYFTASLLQGMAMTP